MDIRAEIITIGDEILWGQITDTNSQYLSARLTEAGIRTVQKTSVGDTAGAITEALTAALGQAEIVLITGGLGPTKDDITKKTLADFFDSPLAERPEAWADLQKLFAQRKRPINDLNRLQATLPVKAEYLVNERGTAPGMWFDAEGGKAVVSMPGVPSEMMHMMSQQVLPRLKERFAPPTILHRFIQTVAIPESDLAMKIEAWENALPNQVKLAYLPSKGRVKLRLTGTGANQAELEVLLDGLAKEGGALIGRHVFSLKDEDIEQTIADFLVEHKLTLSAAESCTGGAFASRLTAPAGASVYFQGSAVVYSESAKRALGVPPEVIEKHTVYSKECAAAMAEAARRFYGTHFAVSSTGVAGPGPDQGVDPGTIYIAVAGPEATFAKELHLTTDRATNLELAVVYMLDLLRQQLPETLPQVAP